MTKRLSAGLLILFAVLLSACGANESSLGGSSPPPTENQECSVEKVTPSGPGTPPPAVLVASNSCQKAGVGTFCWGPMCADAVGVVGPTTPMTASQGDSLTVMLPFDSQETHVKAWKGDEGKIAQPGDDYVSIWDFPTPIETVFEETLTGSTLDLATDLPPGRYFIDVFSYPESGGDVDYTFHIEIDP